MKIKALIDALESKFSTYGDCEVRILDSTEGEYFTVDEVTLIEDGELVDGYNGGRINKFPFIVLR